MQILLKPAPNTIRAVTPDTDTIILLNFQTFEQVKGDLIKTPAVIHLPNNTTKFESHEGFDFFLLSVPNLKKTLQQPKSIGIYFTGHLLVFLAEDAILKQLSEQAAEQKNTTAEHVLFSFFNQLTIGDIQALDLIEQKIETLEEALITAKKDSCVKEIIELRKNLRILKRYYEQLLDIAEDIEENENNLLSGKTLRYFKMLTGRINRLLQNVNALRESVTQVREAYQAQVDINLNRLMEVFTVLTAVFLPLTLIVGWYGMNLKMPEFGWAYGYPFVIALSLAVVALTIWIFKKNKWF